MAKNKRRITRQVMEAKRRRKAMTQVSTEQLVSMIGAKQVQIEIMQNALQEAYERACPDRAAHDAPPDVAPTEEETPSDA